MAHDGGGSKRMGNSPEGKTTPDPPGCANGRCFATFFLGGGHPYLT